MNRLIVLVGFMGTGKSTVGRLIAERLGWRFADTDTLIVQRAGKSIPEIFAEHGEAHFRQIESDVCAEIAGWQQAVIATGGGIVLNPINRERLCAAGMVVCLRASADHIAARIGDDANRPMLAGADRQARIAALLAERAPSYDAIPYQIDSSGLSPLNVAQKVITLWQTHAH